MPKILLISLLTVFFLQAQTAAGDFSLSAGATSAGFSLGAKYRAENGRLGIRAAYFPGVGAVDFHAHRLTPTQNGFAYLGPEIIYLRDKVVLTDRNFTAFEWLAIQGILGRHFHIRPTLGFAVEGGLGVRLYTKTTYVGTGPPIEFPISIILRAEFVFDA